ncbi:hypothetical protein NFC81_09225 [Salinispirillum sp. LH 10-3-1]|uniref:Uncharacterized protein n=1 Tax=Salinispirillum sp. LH 10-3-1 TaxID=2952525 RepID=A0AB38YC90_9GAMM
MKKILSCTLFITLSGCASTMVWHHPDMASQNFYSDRAHCNSIAGPGNHQIQTQNNQPQNFSSGFTQGWNNAAAASAVQRQSQIFNDCMRGKGYYLAPENTAPENPAPVKTSSLDNAKDRFWDDIEEAIPYWQDLQSTDAGQRWLLGNDPLSGRQRNEILLDAADQLDSQRVIAIFRQLERDIGYQPQASLGPDNIVAELNSYGAPTLGFLLVQEVSNDHDIDVLHGFDILSIERVGSSANITKATRMAYHQPTNSEPIEIRTTFELDCNDFYFRATLREFTYYKTEIDPYSEVNLRQDWNPFTSQTPNGVLFTMVCQDVAVAKIIDAHWAGHGMQLLKIVPSLVSPLELVVLSDRNDIDSELVPSGLSMFLANNNPNFRHLLN